MARAKEMTPRELYRQGYMAGRAGNQDVEAPPCGGVTRYWAKGFDDGFEFHLAQESVSRETPEQRAGLRPLDAMPGTPCEFCDWLLICQRREFACPTFAEYVLKGDWPQVPSQERMPSRRMFERVTRTLNK